MESQPILGQLQPIFDGVYVNDVTKTKIGTFGLWKVPHIVDTNDDHKD